MSNMSELKTELDTIREVANTAIAMCDVLENKITQAEPEPKSPVARAEYGDEYYYINADGNILPADEDGMVVDDRYYAVANYCTDFNLLQQRAWHEELSRLLWRYSEEHGGDAEWEGGCFHYRICQSQSDGVFRVEHNDDYKGCCTAYFRSEEIAEAAIRDIVEPFIKVHPDFKW